MLKHIRKRKHPKKEIISDHAIVRFLERTQVVNIKAFRRQLMTKGLRQACAESREKTDMIIEYVENGLEFVIDNGTVKTILTPDIMRMPNGEKIELVPGIHYVPRK